MIFKFRKLREKVFVTVQWSKRVVGTERWHIPIMILIDIAPPSSENWPKMYIFVDEEGIAYIELAEITIDSHRINFDAFRYTYTGHCEPRIKENAVHCQPIERESTVLRWCSRQHNWRLSYRTSAHPPTLYRSPHLTLLRSSSCSHCCFLLALCSPLASTARIVVPSVPRDGGTVNSTNADAICILATTDTIKCERYSYWIGIDTAKYIKKGYRVAFL